MCANCCTVNKICTRILQYYVYDFNKIINLLPYLFLMYFSNPFKQLSLSLATIYTYCQCFIFIILLFIQEKIINKHNIFIQFHSISHCSSSHYRKICHTVKVHFTSTKNKHCSEYYYIVVLISVNVREYYFNVLVNHAVKMT